MQDPDFQEWANERGLKSGKASDTYARWLIGFDLHPEQMSLLTEFVLKETSWEMDECYSHGVWLFDESTIPTCPDANKALQEDLLLIGGCPNGDYLATDLRVDLKQIGFVSHEQLWCPDPPPVRDCFLSLGMGFGEYVQLEKQGHYICDFYDAQSYLHESKGL